MTRNAPMARRGEIQALLELTWRVGSDPLLTQGSTGNSSAKLDGVLWIKASGRWMADSLTNEILIPLDLAEMQECIRQDVDPSARYPCASLETAMHTVLPHRVVLHVHCVSTIAWAVRRDAPVQLQSKLDGLRWQWIPYVASGLPLAREIEHILSASPETNIFVLGNHGLVIAGEDPASVERLLVEVRKRLDIIPRKPHPADYAALLDVCWDSPWDLPDDDAVHALGTDPISQRILAGGLLYPCQAIFSDSTPDLSVEDLFCPIPLPRLGEDCRGQHADRPFLIVEGRGVVVRKSMTPAELAMMSGLAQVVQRLGVSSCLRYLTGAEVAAISGQAAYHYRELASVGQAR
jgi:rhamnose utilization protein RhaD (predicted bifunctional aldolase and dehydrogenase)